MSVEEADQEIDDHVAELTEELSAEPQEIKQALQNLLEYSVPVDEAKRSVRRRFQSETSAPSEPSTLDISEVEASTSNAAVRAVVVSGGKRSIRIDGEDTVIVEGELSDSSGTIDYTCWTDFGYEPGDTVEFSGVNVREWNDELQINVNESTDVREVDGLDEPPVQEAYGVRELADVESGDRGCTLEVEVVDTEERVIDGRDEETRITSGVFGDGSGRLPFTDWMARDFDEGDSIRIENAYVNDFRGVAQVNLGEFTEVSEIGDLDVDGSAPETTVAEAIRNGGIYDVQIRGSVLEVKDGSGLIQRCPDCGRVIQKGQCRTHGKVDGDGDMRTKAVLDDGTAAVNLILDRELSEKIYGDDMEAALEEAREAMDQSVVSDSISERVVGRTVRVRGHVSLGEYGANMEATELSWVTEDATEAADALLEKYEIDSVEGGDGS
ncbi:MAG: Single-stranded DNA binding protein [Halobacteria archaeon]